MAKYRKAFLNEELGNPLLELKWPTKSFKAQPKKVTPAKPARVERQKSLTIPTKWLGDQA